MASQNMWYVYIIQSTSKEYRYIGSTNNLERRLNEHNKGECRASSSYRPFRVAAYIAVRNRDRALRLEKYLKSGSGMSFLKKRII